MRKLNLEAALEAMDAMSAASEDDETLFAAVEAMELPVETADHEFTLDSRPLTECIDTMDQLMHMRAIILEYGISAPMMKMADPNGELVAAGICGSYESLADVPEKGDAADIALEGLASAIKGLFAKLVGVFKAKAVEVDDYEAAQAANAAKLSIQFSDFANAISRIKSLDMVKFNATSVYSFSKDELKKVIDAHKTTLDLMVNQDVFNSIVDAIQYLKGDTTEYDKAVKTIEDIQKRILEDASNKKEFEVCGIEIKANSAGDVVISSTKPPLQPSNRTIKVLGFTTVSDVLAAMKNIVHRMEEIVRAGKNLEVIGRGYQALAVLVDAKKNNDKFSDEDARKFKHLVNDVATLLAIGVKMYSSTTPIERLMIASGHNVAKATIAAKD